MWPDRLQLKYIAGIYVDESLCLSSLPAYSTWPLVRWRGCCGWSTISDEGIENSADNTKDIYIMHAGIDIFFHHVTLSTIMLCVHVYFEGFSLKALYLQVTFLYCSLTHLEVACKMAHNVCLLNYATLVARVCTFRCKVQKHIWNQCHYVCLAIHFCDYYQQPTCIIINNLHNYYYQ